MREHYGKYDYREAKAFLKDAKLIQGFTNSGVYTARTWEKPDGTRWYEYDCLLEAPESDYRLELLRSGR